MPNVYGVRIGEWSKNDVDDGKMRISPLWLGNNNIISKPIIFVTNLSVSSYSKVGIGWGASDTDDPSDLFNVKVSSTSFTITIQNSIV